MSYDSGQEEVRMSHVVRRFVIPTPENPDDLVSFVELEMPYPVIRCLDVGFGFDGETPQVVIILETTDVAETPPVPTLTLALVKDGGEIPDDYQPVEWAAFEPAGLPSGFADERMIYVPTSITFISPIP